MIPSCSIQKSRTAEEGERFYQIVENERYSQKKGGARMISRGFWTIGILAIVLFVAPGCKTAPETFIKTMEPGWKTVEVREGMEKEELWHAVLDTVARKYDIEVIAKDSGYLRSAWLHQITGTLREDYRSRIIVKFSQDWKKVDIKIESHFLVGGSWVIGYDFALLEDVYGDIQGKVGSVRR